MPLNLPERIAASAPVARRIAAIGNNEEPVVFYHVSAGAQACLAAAIRQEAAPKARVWVIAESIRAQEGLYTEMLNWEPGALFLPEAEIARAEGALPDAEIAADRLQALKAWHEATSGVLVLTATSLDEEVPKPGAMQAMTLELVRHVALPMEELLSKLDVAGYVRVNQVSERGQYAQRGGIVDLFSWQHSMPLRVEFFGDELDSLRFFDPDVQTAVEQVERAGIMLGDLEEERCRLRDCLRADDLLIAVETHVEGAQVEITMESPLEGEDDPMRDPAGFPDHGLGEFEAGDLVVEAGKRQLFLKQLEEWLAAGWTVQIYCNNEGERERFRDLLPGELLELKGLELLLGVMGRGFIFPSGKLAVLADSQLFGRYRNQRARRLALRRQREQAHRAQIDFTELAEDDAVVHLEHGIARFIGLEMFARGNGAEEEVMVLEFARGAKLYVPLEQAYLVSRYVGIGKRDPQLSELGDAKWQKAKTQASKAVMDYAARLLAVHAERESAVGYAFPEDHLWQGEFERSFLFKETPDQLTAIAETKADMEGERPMDRLICGDVGFGKTEVAIRAAFKAVVSGKQVAILVPTTVLAQQHYQTFRERMSDYPVTVELLSRFRTPGQQKKVLEGMKDGSVDIVVGTHRLISKDVAFKELGLVVIDEEQRFGVLHKERFKELFKRVDVLTLSATPIPRTLYLSLMGAKDMSILETPPQNRIPTETVICGYDERIIRDAIEREMAREGQVFFLHNRVGSIELMRQKIRKLVPKAKVVIGHGQMPEQELEVVMKQFVEGEADVLLSTTIIESGLDIPNANTIIIDRADRFGLADLYQLRGRVGRAQQKAYAYLMIPRDLMRSEAKKRINAIRQYSSLGAGFKIAMRDLEIRGAGNILGTQQSGHIVAVGFDLYCQLLRQAVAKLKGETVEQRVEVPVSLDFVETQESEALKGSTRAAAFLPTSLISEAQTRIQAYRALAGVTSHEGLDALEADWRDRFGRLPEPVTHLLLLQSIRLIATEKELSRVEVKDLKVMLTRNGDYITLGGKFPRLTKKRPGALLKELHALLRKF